MVCTNSKKPSRKVSLIGLGITGILGALSLAVFGGMNANAPKEVKAEEIVAEERIESDRLSFSITSSASTATSHAFRVTASSSVMEAVSNSSRYNNVFVVVDDPSWPGSFAKAKEEAAAEQEEAGESYVAPHYSGRVYAVIPSGSAANDIVIPETLSYSGNAFYIDVLGIGADAVESADTYAKIKSIAIPKTITYIEANAFKNVPDTVAINVEAKDASAFEAGWTDATNVKYGVKPDQSKLNLVATSTPRTFGTAENFIIGMKREGYEYPLQCTYRLLDKDQKQYGDYITVDLPISSTNRDYDAVGSDFSVSTNFVVDIDVPEGYHVDDHDIVFHNVFPALSESKKTEEGKTIYVYYPDVDHPYYAIPRSSFSQTIQFSDLFANRPGSVTAFGEYTKVGLYLKRDLAVYKEALPKAYETFKQYIESGTYSIRHQFVALAQASYDITWEANGQLHRNPKVKIVTPISNAVIETLGEMEMGFVVKNSDVGEGFTADSLRSINFEGFNVKLDLYNNEKDSRVNKSDLTIRFSSLVLMNNEVQPSGKVNLTLVTVFAFLIFVALFAVLAMVYYVYTANKYKNDEFRRVNGKRYVKSAIKNGIGATLVFGAIFFIIARWVLFDTTVVVFNPIDAFVIIFTIAGAIYLGFAIKNMVASIKDSRKRKEAVRLHLDKDLEDDGTK